jgi:hypothetical protein
MEIYNAYEVLDRLAEKSKMFKMINEDFKAKDTQIAELKAKNEVLEADQLSTLEAIAELYEMMLGGVL